MSGTDETRRKPAEAEDGNTRDSFLRRFWRLARGYYTGPERRSAWMLSAGVIALTLAQIAIQVRFNLWNRDFFNALEARDRAAFFGQMGTFLLLTAASMSVAVFQLYVRQLLQLRWRQWLVFRLQNRWLDGSRHYQMNFLPDIADNPDQRISENTRWATAMAVDMAVGLFQSVVMLISFVGILWTLSGPLMVAFGSNEFEIPGYMVFAALIYAIVGSTLTYLIGRPMVDINIRRNQAESDHRFALIRIRENSEGVALIRGETDEDRGLRRSFGHVVSVMKDLMRTERRLMWLTSAYGMVAGVFPILVASPRYFSGAITLGVLMQIGSAFGEVTRALNWFVDNFPRLADWRSHVERVAALEDSLDTADLLDQESRINVTEGPLEDGREVLAFQNLQIAQADGNILVGEANAVIEAGEKVLIVGESGTGKSTLFRAISGVWPWGSGEVRVPRRDHMMFMPQRPYLPLGSLRGAIAYPAAPRKFSDSAIIAALQRCGLAHLTGRLDEEERWDRILSLGEQQRLAFARLLLHRPRWIFMDEATAALDEANQDAMMGLFQQELSESALISIGHRPGLDLFHDRTLHLVRSPDGAKLTTPRRTGTVGVRRRGAGGANAAARGIARVLRGGRKGRS
ncbi:ABC transporter ATP-binding protein/permease [Roseomonas sp. SSH11]|uniref:ABC transporter ATP-binding protein/permease n=1 Tax=Pararoseomonas baculiformis TaxID=2820812 RepID=A0ABS4A8G3_9PROT|nr:ABC transporter ATP-binding protein/permease [Pararoseomonas baculiformis]MBP0443286.1 ABC transporter ATP-binding protein/permease [Pararoseomonas baculiformis]